MSAASRLLRVVLPLVLVVSVAGICAASVEQYLDRTVTAVRLTIEGVETTDAALLDVIQTRVGRPLVMADVRETIGHLYSLGRFEDVQAEAALAPTGGVILLYVMTPLHPITGFEFEGDVGLPGIDAETLRRAIVDRFGSSVSRGRVDDIVRLVDVQLNDAGYRHAVVGTKTELRHDPGRAVLTLVIRSGDRTKLGRIEVIGSPAVNAEVRRRLQLQPGAPYQDAALQSRIDQYVETQRGRGYYEARIGLAVEFEDSDRIANLTLTAELGPHGRVVFTGDPLPSDKRAELVPVEREGSADQDLLEDSVNRIEDYLHTQGFRDANVTFRRERSGDELLITFDVRRGPQYRIERIEVAGNASVGADELLVASRLRESQNFSAADRDTALGLIEEFYRRRGFASARAEGRLDPIPGRATAADVPSVLRITIREGVKTTVQSIAVVGAQAKSEADLRQAIALQPGGPFYEARLRADEEAIQGVYADLGYLGATVRAVPNFSEDRSAASPVFTVNEGQRLFVDHVLIIGNLRTNSATIQRELQFKPGDPLSRAAIVESQRRLAALGLFRRTRITELRHGDETRRDLLVTVEEGPATTIGYGGGFEARLRVVRSSADSSIASQKLEFAPRASFEIGRRNLFGKNRSVNLFTSLSLHPNSSATASDSSYGFSEYRVLGTFREPRVFETTADAYITGTVEQQIRSSFNFSRQSIAVEVARKLARGVSVSGNYQLQQTHVFDLPTDSSDQRFVDRLFPQVRLSSFSASTIHDTRDDPVDPSSGHYASVSGQLAARGIGSEVGFIKTFISTQLFRTLPRSRVVLAGSARLGVASAFPRQVSVTDAAGLTTVTTVEDLPASERFFAGGDTTVRGYALDTLGTSQTKDNDGFPLGGGGLAIFNAEIRVPVLRGRAQVVGFVDAGNVFLHPSDFALRDMRAAVGFGVRYKSPVGPLRVDLGFKLHRDEVSPGVREGLTALHISLGQAF